MTENKEIIGIYDRVNAEFFLNVGIGFRPPNKNSNNIVFPERAREVAEKDNTTNQIVKRPRLQSL